MTLLVGMALGALLMAGLIAGCIYIAAVVMVTGRWPRLPWIDDKPGDE